MRILAQVISWLSLLGTLVPAIAFLAGTMTLDTMKTWMLVGTVIWFVTVPVWMGRPAKN